MNTEVSTAKFVGTEARALELLGSGYEANVVAKSLGLSEGRISQLLHEEDFASALAERRFAQLRKHNETDDAYDRIEKKLIEQLERVMPLCMRPMEVVRMLQIINSAKRRGVSAPDHLQASQRKTVTLNIPIQVVQRFQMNAASQVVAVSGEEGATESLVTIQSGNVQRLLNEHAKEITSTVLIAPDDPTKKSREWREYRREVRAIETAEVEGRVYRKSQGRESVDLLAECGFTEEIKVVSPSLQGSQ